MMQGVYSVFDRKAKVFGILMFFANDEMAKRGAADLMRAGGDSPMNHYPDDFDVYKVGTFESDTGEIVGQVAELVVRFSDFKGA